MSIPPRSGPPREPPQPNPPEPPAWQRWLWPLIITLMFVFLLLPGLLTTSLSNALPYSTFVTKVDAGQVQSVSIDDKGAVSGTFKSGKDFTSQIPTALDTTALDRQLSAHHVEVTATQSGASFGSILLSLLPLILLVGLAVWVVRSARKSLSGGVGGFGRSRAKIIERERPETRFADVAGYEGVKQEISEVVDFLRHPSRYSAAGAKGPRGVMMVGPPGTGKTLLARAVAGEAEVPFLSVTGSAFVEMFVGVGASRVRDLFSEARQAALRRSSSSTSSTRSAASAAWRRARRPRGARADTQPAARRDGRLRPEQRHRGAGGHQPARDPGSRAAAARGASIGRSSCRCRTRPSGPRSSRCTRRANGSRPDVDLGVIARATPGFSGADLANLLNEAAINAVRDGRTTVSRDDLDDRPRPDPARPAGELELRCCPRSAIGRRARVGPRAARRAVRARRPGGQGDDPARRHGAGRHRAAAGGRTAPVQRELPDRPAHRAARRARRRAGRVRRGLDRRCERPEQRDSDRHAHGARVRSFQDGRAGRVRQRRRRTTSASRPPEQIRRPYSEQTQRIVDEEVARLLRKAEERAVAHAARDRAALEDLAALLVEHETVDGDVVLRVLREHAEGGVPPRAGKQPHAPARA